MIPNDILLNSRHKMVSCQVLSERLLLVADGNSCKEPKPDIMWKEYKLEVYFGSLLSETGVRRAIGGRKIVGGRGIDNTNRTWPTKLTKHGSFELSETEVGNTGPSWICTRSSVCVMALWVFVGLITVGTAVSLTLLPVLGNLFLQLGCLVQSQYVPGPIGSCFAIFGFWLLEVCYFLKGNRGGAVDLGEKESVGELGIVEGRETGMDALYKGKNLFST